MHYLQLVRIASVFLIGGCCFVVRPAQASFHLWEFVEVFSSADGSIQFMELLNANLNNQQFASTNSGEITSIANSFSFPTDLPSSATANRTFLVGTASYDLLAQADVNVPLPDYVVVDNFFSTAGDTLTLKQFSVSILDAHTFTAGDLPTDGINSLNHAFLDPTNTFFSATNSPTNFSGETGTVTIVIPSADFNGDEEVNGEDFLIWQRFAGGAGGLSQGDANNDGNVDGDDLAVWETQYGLPVALAGLAAIPEPQSVYLMLWGLLAFCRRCREAN